MKIGKNCPKGTKVRITLKRIVQPPIDTQASIDYHSIEITVDKTTKKFIEGADVSGCGVSVDVVGIEKLLRGEK